MSAVFVTDELGPRGRKRVRIATFVSAAAIIALVALALVRLGQQGQLEAELYTQLADIRVFRRLLSAFLFGNLSVASVSMALSLSIGLFLALGRLARSRWVHQPVGTFVEFFRAVPVLLFIFLIRFGLPEYGIRLPNYWFVVIALTCYHSSVLAEVYRAGILSLALGQREAATSLGMTYWQAMFLVILPQAVRRMAPAIISQLVTLIKDTTLAFIIGFGPEMLRDGQQLSQLFDNRLQTLTLVALIFVAVNYALSRFASWLERRQRRRYGAVRIEVAGGPEDLALGEEDDASREPRPAPSPAAGG